MDKLEALIFSDTAPNEEQKEKFISFLEKKYNSEIILKWQYTDKYKGGFRLKIGAELYDWTAKGRLKQIKESIYSATENAENVIPLLKDAVFNWNHEIKAEEMGTVTSVSDCVATVAGLHHATYGEILLFEHKIKGMVQNITENELSCIIFGDESNLSEGSNVYRTKKTAGVPVGDEFIGRVVNALGAPIDGKGNIDTNEFRPIEHPAPGIIERQPVDTPLQTGILTVDSMFPIGKGQRELIIGDRQTGKTAIAVDTILNQKGKDVICIYVAIGQKMSSVAQLYKTLQDKGAMDYTVIVNASAADSASLQYISPYSATAIGEYFMDNGKDVLIVYDDLSKHAVAYRSLSLLLDRSPGREAYPGDVFYLHSRLLERSAHLCDELGGGSMTALPIVETKEGDVSAYIPTNIISITDGQLFLETGLFFSGQRPAINVGISVSRVGGDAQTKAMKSAVGTLRLDLAQTREMKVFTQFSSDLDEETQNKLAYGQTLMNILRQPQYSPYTEKEQIVLLVSALGHKIPNLSVKNIGIFISRLIAHFHKKHETFLENLSKNEKLSDENKKYILSVTEQFAENFKG